MKYVFLVSCFFLLASSAFATTATKDELRKEVAALRRIMAREVQKSENMYAEIANGIFGALNRLYVQSVESLETIKNLNATEVSIWRARASFANVSIFECTFQLAGLAFVKLDAQDELRMLINDEWAQQVRVNRELSEAINQTIVEEVISLNDKIEECGNNDDTCLDFIETNIKSDWERLPNSVATGLKEAAQWFTKNLVLENVRDVVRKFKANAEDIEQRVITCIKQKLQ